MDEQLQDDGSLKIWQAVPDDSIFELRIVSQHPQFGATARVVRTVGGVQIWPHEDLHPGPKQVTLHSEDRSYVVNVVIGFDSGDVQPVDIDAQIIDGGVPFDTPYFHRVTGGRGDIVVSKIIINMI